MAWYSHDNLQSAGLPDARLVFLPECGFLRPGPVRENSIIGMDLVCDGAKRVFLAGFADAGEGEALGRLTSASPYSSIRISNTSLDHLLPGKAADRGIIRLYFPAGQIFARERSRLTGNWEPVSEETVSPELAQWIQAGQAVAASGSAETKPENNPSCEREGCLPRAAPAGRKIFNLERPDRHDSCPVHVQTAAEP